MTFWFLRFSFSRLVCSRGAAKRFNLTKGGKVKRAKAYKSHILTKKSTKRLRGLRQTGYIAEILLF